MILPSCPLLIAIANSLAMSTVRIGNERYKAGADEIPSFKIPDYVDLINMKKFSFKDATIFDSSTKQKVFYFDNYIQVIYQKANANGLHPGKRPSEIFKNETKFEAKLLSEEPLPALVW
jgi:hypothetical protein